MNPPPRHLCRNKSYDKIAFPCRRSMIGNGIIFASIRKASACRSTHSIDRTKLFTQNDFDKLLFFYSVVAIELALVEWEAKGSLLYSSGCRRGGMKSTQPDENKEISTPLCSFIEK